MLFRSIALSNSLANLTNLTSLNFYLDRKNVNELALKGFVDNLKQLPSLTLFMAPQYTNKSLDTIIIRTPIVQVAEKQNLNPTIQEIKQEEEQSQNTNSAIQNEMQEEQEEQKQNTSQQNINQSDEDNNQSGALNSSNFGNQNINIPNQGLHYIRNRFSNNDMVGNSQILIPVLSDINADNITSNDKPKPKSNSTIEM